MNMRHLEAFVKESNAIENIDRRPSVDELAAHRHFLGRKVLTVERVAGPPGAWVVGLLLETRDEE